MYAAFTALFYYGYIIPFADSCDPLSTLFRVATLALEKSWYVVVVVDSISRNIMKISPFRLSQRAER